MQVEAWTMKTVDGQNVYTNGRGIYWLGDKEYGTPILKRPLTTPETRERLAKRAEAQIGCPCKWERDGFAEIIDI